MTNVPHADVQALIDQSRRKQRLFAAYLHGYRDGYQDHEAGKTFAAESFEQRVEALFAQVASQEGWGDD